MKRYTHRLEKPEGNCRYFLIPDKEECDAAENKLGQHEDIEEFLDIDFITLAKAVMNGIWFIHDGKIMCSEDHRVYWSDYELFIYSYGIWLKLSDYKKTWALTKEDLENTEDDSSHEPNGWEELSMFDTF